MNEDGDETFTTQHNYQSFTSTGKAVDEIGPLSQKGNGTVLGKVCVIKLGIWMNGASVCSVSYRPGQEMMSVAELHSCFSKISSRSQWLESKLLDTQKIPQKNKHSEH